MKLENNSNIFGFNENWNETYSLLIFRSWRKPQKTILMQFLADNPVLVSFDYTLKYSQFTRRTSIFACL